MTWIKRIWRKLFPPEPVFLMPGSDHVKQGEWINFIAISVARKFRSDELK